jgi:hypothetical protein
MTSRGLLRTSRSETRWPAEPDPGLPARRPSAGYGPTLAITVMLAAAAFLIVMSLVLLLSHKPTGLGAFAGLVNQQNQSAKTLLYVIAFGVILPLAVLLVPRLADRVAGGPNAAALSALAAALVASLAGVLIVVRLSRTLPWGDGLNAVLGGVGLWSLAAATVLCRAAGTRPWPALSRLQSASAAGWLIAGVLLFGTLVGVTSRRSLHPVPLAVGAAVGVAVLLGLRRLRVPEKAPWVGRAVDIAAIVALGLAVPNLVVFHASGQLPNIYLPPGVIQDQQNYLLGSVNQLLGGGALLVNVPVSQYGVGLIYFLAGWFHLAPIGYGTLGFLDSILTALFYIAGYAVLRVAGVRRPLAVAAMVLAVVALIYGLHYAVGALPETGPLRFGLPMALVLAKVMAERRRRALASAAAFAVLGVSAVWAFEAFAYTVLTFAAITLAELWLRAPGDRRRWLGRRAALALAACVIAHVLLALATLVGSGQLPDWGQYLAYIRSFLLGGRAGIISFGFADWSPGLAVGAAALASAAAVVLLVRRAPGVARRDPATLVALVGTTAYAIALLSYADNRSSTYLLPYVTLPLLIAAALWLALLLRQRECPQPIQRGGLAFALAVAVLLTTAAWTPISGNFSETALAHAYPGGGLGAALHRLWHPPAIDPRAPEGERLLHRFIPGPRALILLPTVPDLAVEILMRSGRTSPLFIADPIDDGLVPSVWLPKLRVQVARLRAGQRLLIDRSALKVLADLRAHPAVDPTRNPIDLGDQEDEWLLRAIDERCVIRPIYRDPGGLIVAQLAPRGA